MARYSEKRRYPRDIQEFIGTATGTDAASQKSGTYPLTPLQETKDNIRRDNALFQQKAPVVCREIFSKNARPDYSWEMEIGA